MHEGDVSCHAPNDRHWPAAPRFSVEICDAGLVFGAGSVLVRMTGREGGAKRLALETDRTRVLTLLSVAYRRPVAAGVLRHIEAASDHWQRGDKALANLRLVFAGLPRLDDPTDAARLRLAEYCLDEGLPPHVLMRELGLDSSSLEKYGYDPNEPRDEGGRWTRDGGRDGTFVVASNDPKFFPHEHSKESASDDEPEANADKPHLGPRVVPASPLDLPLLPNPGGRGPPAEVEPPAPSTAPAEGPTAHATTDPVSVDISASRFGEAAQHMSDAQAAGKPSILTIDRLGADSNRAAAISGIAKVPGMHLDEYPPAMFAEGGTGASVRAVSPSTNRAAGAYIGNKCRPLPNGSQVKLRVVE